jgi:hypothetical protein
MSGTVSVGLAHEVLEPPPFPAPHGNWGVVVGEGREAVGVGELEILYKARSGTWSGGISFWLHSLNSAKMLLHLVISLSIAGSAFAAPFLGQLLERQEQVNGTYDYIIAGGGTAVC